MAFMALWRPWFAERVCHLTISASFGQVFTINPELSGFIWRLSESLLRRRDQCAPRMVLRNTPAVDIHFAKSKLRLGIAFVGEWRQ